jgi:4-hydroxybenzoate polyprenyltransferase
MMPIAESPVAIPPRSTNSWWRALIKSLRPHQWTKNTFCLAGLIFGTRLGEAPAWRSALIYLGFFCAVSSCMYLVNDLHDLERDRLHPKKRFRPLPSGDISPFQASLFATLLGVIGLSSFFIVDSKAFYCLAAYAAINLFYSIWLKHRVLLDVFGIALGFVLRMLGGVYAVQEMPTTWITLCTFFLALFLGFAKRRAELAELISLSSNSQRPVLAKYTLPYLDSLLNGTATMTIMSYALFTAGAGKNPTLIISVPMVYVAIMHYKFLVLNRKGGEEPDRIVLHDRQIQFWILLWLITYLCVVNTSVRLFK